MNKKKACVVITSRGNYGKLKSVMAELRRSEKFELQVVVGGSVVLDKYGKIFENEFVEDILINATSYFLVEGETPITMAKSAGLALIEFSNIFENLKPDLIFVIADRYECLSISMAAAYMNIPIAHIEGGEVSGSIDELIRHAISKMSHIHFPASEDAAFRIQKMGEDSGKIFNVGSTSFDVLSSLALDDLTPVHKYKSSHGVGADFKVIKDQYIVLAQHPVTTEYDQNFNHMMETLHGVAGVSMPVVCVWPNMDAGADGISKAIRVFRENKVKQDFYVFKGLPIEIYGPLIANAACVVGNSSSGIRECGFLGTPSVNVGTRQSGRQRGRNVIDCINDASEIREAINKQLDHGRYAPDYIYGDGLAGKKIVECLSNVELNIQKIITY